jgi:8-oxo-dGTP pyrophosphatase MutT (NUDIX family)
VDLWAQLAEPMVRVERGAADMVPPKREAIVAIIRRGATVLLIQRAPGVRQPGFWAPLSGTIEPNESQEDALVREVREEVGLEVAPVAKVWESATDDGSFVLHWWTADPEAGPVKPDPREVSGFQWVTATEFLELQPTFEGDRIFFEQILPHV